MADSRYLDIFKDSNFTESRRDYLMAGDITYTPWEVAKSNFGEIYQTGIVGLGVANVFLSGVDAYYDSPTLTPEEFKSIGMDVPEEMTATEASYRQELKEDRYLNQLKNARMQSDGGFFDTAVPFVGSIAGGIAGDGPLYIAGGAALRALGGAVTAGATRAGYTGIQTATQAVRATMAGRVLSNAAGEGLIAAFAENPLQRRLSDSLGVEFTDEDARNNIYSAIAFSGLADVFSEAFGKTWSKAFKKNAIETANEGKVISKSVVVINDAENFRDIPKGTPGPTGDGPFTGRVYSAHNAPNRDFNYNTQDNFGKKYGEGVVASTSRDITVNRAKSDLMGTKGQVVELDLSDANLMDLEVPMSVPMKDEIVARLRDIDKSLADAVNEADGTAEQIIDSLMEVASRENKPEVRDAVNEVVKSNGYDGYKFSHKDINGEYRGQGDFGVHVFDPEKFTMGQVEDLGYRDLNADTPFYKDMNDADADYYNSIESQMNYVKEDFDDLLNVTPKLEYQGGDLNRTAELSDFSDSSMMEVREGLDTLDEGVKSEIQPEIDDLEVSIRESELSEEVMKASIFCNKR